MVHLTRDEHGSVWARLLDLFPAVRARGCQPVLGVFHIVNLASKVVEDVRRRVQQEFHGHRCRKKDPLCRIRNIHRAGKNNLADRAAGGLESVWVADERILRWRSPPIAQQVPWLTIKNSYAHRRVIADKPWPRSRRGSSPKSPASG